MSRSQSVRAARAPLPPPETPTRGLLLRMGLYWGTLVLLGIGSCTLAFWILASQTGTLSVGTQELFVIRAIGLIALALGAAGIFFILGTLRRMTLPIRDMTTSAERIAQGDYSARVEEKGPRELRSLARSFNSMAEDLGDNEAKRRTLLANIANELRTPLSMLRENIEGLVDGNFARDDAHLNLILGETIRLSNLVDEMRMLALAESGGLILQREPTELNSLVRDTVALYHRDASARNIGLHAIVPDAPLTANVDPARIGQALGNLIDDALHANLKSDVRVELAQLHAADKQSPAEATIQVAYRARVIAPEQIQVYFDRFYQPAASDPADDSGLDLAITKLLVEAHGGAVSVASDARSGTLVTCTLPLMQT